MYKHILIATDGSELADKGVAHGLGLAAAVGAAVTIVTVTEDWSPTLMASEVQAGRTDVIERYEKSVEQRAHAILGAASKSAEGRGVAVDTLHIKDSHPAEGILEAAKETGCDLIVMASHGRRGVRRLFLGSQASEVLAHTGVPVLVVR